MTTARIKAQVKPALLVWGRETAGYGPEEAAKKLNVTIERLLAWERGENPPTIAQLRNMARIYRRPLSVFYLQEVPTTFMAMHDFRRLPGGGPRRYSPGLTLEVRAAQQRRELALELLEDLGEEPLPFTFTATLEDDPEATGERIREVLDVTYNVQRQWRDPRIAFNNWRMRIEALDALVFQMTRVEADEVSGLALAEELLPVIAVNRKTSFTRRTFSLLHEFTHLMLRLSGVSDLDVDAERPPEDQRVEVFCNRVAAAALMPQGQVLSEPRIQAHRRDRDVWNDDDISDLATIYSVSREALLRRLLTFGLTTQQFYRTKRAQYNEEFLAQQRRQRERQKGQDFRRNPPRDAISTIGKPFVRLVLDNYYQDRITLRDVSSYLGVRVKHFPRIEQAIGNETV
jgi:Zn-dependent peptidase ImmA (M78 family)